jgi:hypothetical protein
MTTALAAGPGLLVGAVFGTVGVDADFAVEEPHAAIATVAMASPPKRNRREKRNDLSRENGARDIWPPSGETSGTGALADP